MKKPLLLLAAVLISLAGFSQSFEYNGLQYNVTSENELKCEVAQNSNVSGNLVIPETAVYENKTYSVTSIGEFAFIGCSGLTGVIIPNSVNSIGNSAFWSCSGLTCITIPNSVTSIGEYAFTGCSGLASVTIPNSVNSIGNSAFRSCEGLTSVTIGNSVNSIGNSAFAACTELKSIVVDNGNPAFASIDGILYNKNLDTLICYPAGLTGGFVIPNSVTSIGDEAFSGCSNLSSVTIPTSVTSIGVYSFFGCNGLTSVTIPNSVNEIFKGAFAACSELKSIVVDNGNPSFASIDGILYSKNLDTIICYPAGLTGGFDIPNSVTFISADTFNSCHKLTSVTIPTSVTSIGGNAFGGCVSLKSVTIPNSVTSIEGFAFSNCSGLTWVYIGEKVSDIGFGAFGGCPLLEEVMVAAPMPPSARENIFDNLIFDTATLFVPENSMSSYKSTNPWSNFLSVKTLEESGVEEVVMDSTEGLADVFNLNGQIVKRRASRSDIDALTPGIYVIGGKKIIIK